MPPGSRSFLKGIRRTMRIVRMVHRKSTLSKYMIKKVPGHLREQWWKELYGQCLEEYHYRLKEWLDEHHGK